jgi:hypothetical protein
MMKGEWKTICVLKSDWLFRRVKQTQDEKINRKRRKGDSAKKRPRRDQK